MKNDHNKVCCFGEVLLRISPPERWIENNMLHTYIGGAEGNVATALATWQVPVKYCTAMPDNYMGRDIEQHFLQKQVDTSAIAWQGNRIGLYYMHQGADLKHTGVLYDRFGSSFYDLQPGDINWNTVFANVCWFHFTAITPALSQQAVSVCREALQEASARGIPISLDLNYRSKLWQYGKTPLEIMPELASYCDLIMGNIWAAHTMLGIELDPTIEEQNSKEAYLAHAAASATAIKKQFPRCQTVAFSFRFDHKIFGIKYYGTLYEDDMLHTSEEYEAAQITDKAGSGDCFMAGLIYGRQQGLSADETIRFAAAAAFGKLHEKGDATVQTVADIRKRILHEA